MKKILIISIITFLSLLISTSFAAAKKVLPRFTKKTATKTSGTASGGVVAKARLRSDRRAVIVDFSNLNAATSVSYTLSYNTRGTTQGASGSVNTSEANATREIIFGTCSHGVCRYDSGVTNAKLVLTIKLANGKRIIKTFKLKV